MTKGNKSLLLSASFFRRLLKLWAPLVFCLSSLGMAEQSPRAREQAFLQELKKLGPGVTVDTSFRDAIFVTIQNKRTKVLEYRMYQRPSLKLLSRELVRNGLHVTMTKENLSAKSFQKDREYEMTFNRGKKSFNLASVVATRPQFYLRSESAEGNDEPEVYGTKSYDVIGGLLEKDDIKTCSQKKLTTNHISLSNITPPSSRGCTPQEESQVEANIQKLKERLNGGSTAVCLNRYLFNPDVSTIKGSDLFSSALIKLEQDRKTRGWRCSDEQQSSKIDDGVIVFAKDFFKSEAEQAEIMMHELLHDGFKEYGQTSTSCFRPPDSNSDDFSNYNMKRDQEVESIAKCCSAVEGKGENCRDSEKALKEYESARSIFTTKSLINRSAPVLAMNSYSLLEKTKFVNGMNRHIKDWIKFENLANSRRCGPQSPALNCDGTFKGFANEPGEGYGVNYLSCYHSRTVCRCTTKSPEEYHQTTNYFIDSSTPIVTSPPAVVPPPAPQPAPNPSPVPAPSTAQAQPTSPGLQPVQSPAASNPAQTQSSAPQVSNPTPAAPVNNNGPSNAGADSTTSQGSNDSNNLNGSVGGSGATSRGLSDSGSRANSKGDPRIDQLLKEVSDLTGEVADLRSSNSARSTVTTPFYTPQIQPQSQPTESSTSNASSSAQSSSTSPPSTPPRFSGGRAPTSSAAATPIKKTDETAGAPIGGPTVSSSDVGVTSSASDRNSGQEDSDVAKGPRLAPEVQEEFANILTQDQGDPTNPETPAAKHLENLANKRRVQIVYKGVVTGPAGAPVVDVVKNKQGRVELRYRKKKN